MGTPDEMRHRFLENADGDLKKFSEKIVVPKEYRIIGIRMPVIRSFAKEICKGDWRSYLSGICDEYHEDMMLRGLIIALADMGQDERFRLMGEFIPKMDNWAVCDSFCSALKVNKKNSADVWDFMIPYLISGEEFQIRFPIVMMIFHYIDAAHVNDVLRIMDSVKDDSYYVRMAVAWCISLCFVKFPDRTFEYLRTCATDKWTFNKALSKITDSFRVSDEMKDKIRKMRRK